MFEKFLSENLADFRQRYEGTFGFYRDEKGKRLLVKLTDIGTRCVFVDANAIEYRLNPDTDKDIGFEFLPPKSAWYNTRFGAMFTTRVPQRQFQRGITNKNVSISLLLEGQLTPRRVDFENLAGIYESPLSNREVFTLTKDRSVAISSQFALSRGSIYLLGTLIGGYLLEGKHCSLKLTEPDLWRTEITDALKSMDLTSEIN